VQGVQVRQGCHDGDDKWQDARRSHSSSPHDTHCPYRVARRATVALLSRIISPDAESTLYSAYSSVSHIWRHRLMLDARRVRTVH
jgi:hypothetical protein